MAGRGDRGGIKEKPKNAKNTLLRILNYMSSYNSLLLTLIILSLISNVGNLMGPNYAGKAIAEAASGKGLVNIEKVLYYAKCMIIAYTISGILSFTVNVSMMRIGRKIGQKMRQDVFNKLMKLPVSFFDKNQAGDIISRVSYDIDVVTTSLSTDLSTILSSSITVIGSFVMMLSISIPLVLCMIFTIPAAIFATQFIGKRTKPRYSKRSQSYGIMNGFAEEMFTGQKTIVGYANEDTISKRFEKINHQAADAYNNADGLGAIMGPINGCISNLGLAAIGMGGAVLYTKGIVNLGQISSFILYSRKFAGPINEISNIANEIYSALAAAERIFKILDETQEPDDVKDALTLENSEGNVEAKNVSFSYIKGKTILKDLSFKAKSGQTIAIVGPTGAGKTTIINLLMRFYDVDSGFIYVDENECRQYTLDSLRSNYAMVLQETWLFTGTIFDNIAYGKENATMEEVVAAAKAAHIHNFIMRLPNGYDSIITEDGSNISKGQKQLLTIARAMLYNTNMLILDEATSNVDTNTERKVQKAMRQLMKDKTSFVIAHRLSTIQNADHILVLDHGDVVEQGNHESLMSQKGFYYNLYASQFN